MARKIMRAFKMTEISAVDRPAQVHARMSIMKRDDGNPAATEKEIEMTEAEIAKKIADSVTTATADMTAQLAKANADLKAANDAKAKAEADAEKAKTEKVDLQKANDLAKNDEAIKIGDTEVRKSAVGDSTFAMLKAQNAEIAKANDARELVELTKRAESEFASLPGEAIAKAAVLKAINKMGDAEKATLETMLKGGEAALKLAMKSKGRDGNTGDGASAEEKIDGLTKEYVKAHPGTSFAKAMDLVIQTEEGARLYNESRKAA